MPTNISPAAKAKVAAVAAVAMAGITAWQIATRDGFTWWDLVPVIAAVAGAAVTDGVDNTISSPAAKARVHGALSVVATVAAAIAAVVGPEPAGVSLAKVAVAGLGTAIVWYIPELTPAVRDVQGEVAAHAPTGQVLATVAADLANSHSPWMADPTPPAPAPAASTPRQADAGLPSSAWSLKPVAAGTTTAPVDPAGPPTQPFPAVTAAQPTPAA